MKAHERDRLLRPPALLKSSRSNPGDGDLDASRISPADQRRQPPAVNSTPLLLVRCETPASCTSRVLFDLLAGQLQPRRLFPGSPIIPVKSPTTKTTCPCPELAHLAKDTVCPQMDVRRRRAESTLTVTGPLDFRAGLLNDQSTTPVEQWKEEEGLGSRRAELYVVSVDLWAEKRTFGATKRYGSQTG